MSILHAKQTGLPADDGNTSHVQPSDWYAASTILSFCVPRNRWDGRQHGGLSQR